MQSGFARLGESMWGFSRHGVVPDIVTMGKPMGNGVPISGVVFRPEVSEEFGRNVRYFNTFGGSSIPVAAGAAVPMANLLGRTPDHPWRDACAFVAGYQRERPVKDSELSLLPVAALARLTLRASRELASGARTRTA
ncbi:aminotransferase class III-fold pyridoxal phosphate-dependent enzyme [Streptomyces afghaniensis]|uniref:aminotransferase class III-fold pyridoxal phosphate-dependent enzyme n=1 Tax=Streptomyces afghaniensis TaxID=66865 RepID=UPI00278509B6|nr:aminotransferase class III-fold pyridoxal phosphate-dependent enzyme [Streptomyces afghaniensis]MDQ1022125.1 hypothetical protein [Streptomyces afghaniensis]